MRRAGVLAAGLALVVGATQMAGQDCHPNYAGACVPVAFDVDCAGGKGNGPAYVEGPVFVIGQDIYGLDRDGDGVACEPFGTRSVTVAAPVRPAP
jgi:hypothetical protein